MKNYLLLLLAAVIILPACKQKKKETEKKFISVLSLIEQQVAHVDTALYSIMKIVYTDSLHSDTTYIRREDFRSEAKEFLEIPDLSNRKVASRYKENASYDETLNRVVIMYTPENPDKEEIQKQEILITPNTATGDQVNNIIINRVVSNRNGFLQKNMLWQMDKSFQVVTTTQKPGEPEITTTLKVTWNEDND
jgi:HD superfamily phosphohydrolase